MTDKQHDDEKAKRAQHPGKVPGQEDATAVPGETNHSADGDTAVSGDSAALGTTPTTGGGDVAPGVEGGG